jgi:hypothetical protein
MLFPVGYTQSISSTIIGGTVIFWH